MFTWDAAAMSLALLLAGCADIQQPVSTLDSSRTDDGQSSACARYAWTENREIPDGYHQGILLGPVLTEDDGAELGPLVLRLDIRHPATGDLDIWLTYDADGDGRPDVWGPVEFFRSRAEVAAEELHACPPSLDGTYFFRDDPGDEEAAFVSFRMLPRGHAFFLAVADTLAEQTGSILGWSVLLDGPAVMAQ